MQNHFECLDLDRAYCRVLNLDDAEHGGRATQNRQDELTANFGDVQNGSSVKPKDRLKLGYARVDTLPALPGLAATALEGFAFCTILRKDLRSTLVNDDGGQGRRIAKPH